MTSAFPDREEWRGRILLLETSEEKPSQEKYRHAQPRCILPFGAEVRVDAERQVITTEE